MQYSVLNVRLVSLLIGFGFAAQFWTVSLENLKLIDEHQGDEHSSESSSVDHTSDISGHPALGLPAKAPSEHYQDEIIHEQPSHHLYSQSDVAHQRNSEVSLLRYKADESEEDEEEEEPEKKTLRDKISNIAKWENVFDKNKPVRDRFRNVGTNIDSIVVSGKNLMNMTKSNDSLVIAKGVLGLAETVLALGSYVPVIGSVFAAMSGVCGILGAFLPGYTPGPKPPDPMLVHIKDKLAEMSRTLDEVLKIVDKLEDAIKEEVRDLPLKQMRMELTRGNAILLHLLDSGLISNIREFEEKCKLIKDYPGVYYEIVVNDGYKRTQVMIKSDTQHDYGMPAYDERKYIPFIIDIWASFRQASFLRTCCLAISHANESVATLVAINQDNMKWLDSYKSQMVEKLFADSCLVLDFYVEVIEHEACNKTGDTRPIEVFTEDVKTRITSDPRWKKQNFFFIAWDNPAPFGKSNFTKKRFYPEWPEKYCFRWKRDIDLAYFYGTSKVWDQKCGRNMYIYVQPYKYIDYYRFFRRSSIDSRSAPPNLGKILRYTKYHKLMDEAFNHTNDVVREFDCQTIMDFIIKGMKKSKGEFKLKKLAIGCMLGDERVKMVHNFDWKGQSSAFRKEFHSRNMYFGYGKDTVRGVNKALVYIIEEEQTWKFKP